MIEIFIYIILGAISGIIGTMGLIKPKKNKAKIEQLKQHSEKCRIELSCREQSIKMYKQEIKIISKENREYKSVNAIQKQRLKDLRHYRYLYDSVVKPKTVEPEDIWNEENKNKIKEFIDNYKNESNRV